MKGSISAFEFADIVENAFSAVSKTFEIRKIPVADGGDFTGEVLKRSLGAREISLEVKGPLGAKTKSKYAIAGDIAIIEMADASGMKLVSREELNPLKASSFGTGELIMDAVSKGCSKIYFAIGGSATVDGGIGMMKALGFSFFDKNENILEGSGSDLINVRRIENKRFQKEIGFKIICDVDNPLLGSNGAAHVFGPQKGATPMMVDILEKGLKNWEGEISKSTGKKLKDIKGTGAAGGISVPLLAWFDAEMVAGANFVLDVLDFENHVQWADIVITGEGKIDSQTENNKAPFAVAQVARKCSKPVFAIGGTVEGGISDIFDGVFSLVNGPLTLDFAMKNAKDLLYSFSIQLAKTIMAVKKV